MARIVKSGLIQISIPKSEGDGTIDETKEAITHKHIPLLRMQGSKVFRFFVCRKYLPLHISVPVKMQNGMLQPRPFPVPPSNGCSNMQRSIKWSW